MVGEAPDADPAQRKTTFGRAMISFSPLRNTQKFFSPSAEVDQNMKCLDGIKVVAMVSILLSHFYFHAIGFPIKNWQMYSEFMHSYWIEFVFGGFYAVDAFLFLTAFLGVYLLMLRFAKKNNYNPYDNQNEANQTHKLEVGSIYFLRILRIFP